MEWTIELHSAATEGDLNFLISLLDVSLLKNNNVNNDDDADAAAAREYRSLSFMNIHETCNSRSMDGGEPLLSVCATNESADVRLGTKLVQQ